MDVAFKFGYIGGADNQLGLVQLPLQLISRNKDTSFKFGCIGGADNQLGLGQLPI